jgi:phage terminase large subunit
MGTKPGCRVVCVREVQNSIKDSVKQLISDWIDRHELRGLFRELETEIRGPNESLCIFRGMSDQNNDTIKSLEGFDIAWWEEAQTASKRSLELLRPTIRKPGSELWFTWNPRFKADPVDKLLRQGGLYDEAVVVKANYYDNPWFPDVLELERSLDEASDPARYGHIWLGDYESEADQQLISLRAIEAAQANQVKAEAFDERVIGVDVARFGDDKSCIYYRWGRDGAPEPYERLAKIDTMQLAARVADRIQRWQPDAVFVDDGGVGGGVVDRLHQLGFSLVRGVNFGGKSDYQRTGEKAANKRSEMWLTAREWLKTGSLPIDDVLSAELTGPLFKYDSNNAIVLERKEDMKKRGIPSPDVADAFCLTFAYPVQSSQEEYEHDEADLGRSDATGY